MIEKLLDDIFIFDVPIFYEKSSVKALPIGLNKSAAKPLRKQSTLQNDMLHQRINSAHPLRKKAFSDNLGFLQKESRLSGEGSYKENKPVCSFWRKGNCKFGIKCRNKHPLDIKNIDRSLCRDWQRYRYCVYNDYDMCKFYHGAKKNRMCKDWVRKGKCELNSNCNFRHCSK